MTKIEQQRQDYAAYQVERRKIGPLTVSQRRRGQDGGLEGGSEPVAPDKPLSGSGGAAVALDNLSGASYDRDGRFGG